MEPPLTWKKRPVLEPTLRQRIRMDTGVKDLPDDYPKELADVALHRTDLNEDEERAMIREGEFFFEEGLTKQNWSNAATVYHKKIAYATGDRSLWLNRKPVRENLAYQFKLMPNGNYDEIIEWSVDGSRIMMRAGNRWISKSGNVFEFFVSTSIYFTFQTHPNGMVDAHILYIVDTAHYVHMLETIADYLKDDTLSGGTALKSMMAAETYGFIDMLCSHVSSMRTWMAAHLHSSPLLVAKPEPIPIPQPNDRAFNKITTPTTPKPY
jgi:hypothetical protein